MAKCFITKLNGAVEDNSIPKLGCFYIPVSKDMTSGGKVSFLGTDVTMKEVEGLPIFKNNGNSSIVNEGSYEIVTGEKDCTIEVENKYGLTSFSFYNVSEGLELNLEDLKFSKLLTSISTYPLVTVSGDLDSLKDLTGLTQLNFGKATGITGNLSSLKELTALGILSIDASPITGDLDSLKDLTGLTQLILSNTKVIGNLSSLAGLTGLTRISLGHIQSIIGSLGSLRNLTKLTQLDIRDCTNTTCNLSELSTLTNLQRLYATNVDGNISALPSSVTYVQLQGGTHTGDLATLKNVRYLSSSNQFTWSSRPSSYDIIALNNCVIDNVDKMLQDQAACNAPSNAETKSISVVGTRTSASDSAIETLQNKGYTVSVASA